MEGNTRRIALLIEDDFDDAQIASVREALTAAGLTVEIVGPVGTRTYTGRAGSTIAAEVDARHARIAHYSAVLIPGGFAPDRLRVRHPVLDLVRDAVDAQVPVAAIGHGTQVLISANALRGRTVTCATSIAIDVKNAGGLYYDKPVVEDSSLLTCRKTDDVPALVAALVRALDRRAA